MDHGGPTLRPPMDMNVLVATTTQWREEVKLPENGNVM